MTGDKIADKIVKTNRLPAENSNNVERIVIPPKKDKYHKMEHHRIPKLLHNSTVSKFVTRNCIKVN